jgi:hypothetical protein
VAKLLIVEKNGEISGLLRRGFSKDEISVK